MRILFVAFATSIHTARWISGIADEGWDIHLFPSQDFGRVHPLFKNVTVYHSVFLKDADASRQVRERGFGLSTPIFRRKGAIRRPLNFLSQGGRYMLQTYRPAYRAKQLARLIAKLKPDFIHAMEFQASAYLVLDAKRYYRGDTPFPPLVVTNFGSDVYLFGRLEGHRQRVNEVIRTAAFYTTECHRDVELAVERGFNREHTRVFAIAGGFDLEHCASFRQPGPVHERKLILIKGYQGWAGRALTALRALLLCKDVLAGYDLAIHLPSGTDVAIAAELTSQELGMPIELIPPSEHDVILGYMGRARVHIGLSISDAASTSMLESLVMGAFPIQSWTACADEWFEDGQGGILVPPEDLQPIADALRRALTDDALVDRAAELNWQTALERLDKERLHPDVVAFYNEVYDFALTLRADPQPPRCDDLVVMGKNDARPLPKLDVYPQVTVVTVIRDGGADLQETIDSVLALAYPNFDYLVIDSRSSESPITTLAGIDHEIIRYHRYPDPDEVALSQQLETWVDGDYLLLVGEREPVLPRLLAGAVALMQANPATSIVYPDWHQIDERSCLEGVYQLRDYTYEDIVRLNVNLPLSGLLIQRHLAAAFLPMLLERARGRNFAHWLRLDPATQLAHLPDLAASLRLSRPGSKPPARVQEALDKLNVTRSYFTQSQLSPEQRRHARDSMAAAYYEVATAPNSSWVVRARYALMAWRTRPRLWKSGSRRLPTLYSVFDLMLPAIARPALRLLKAVAQLFVGSHGDTTSG